MDKLFLGFCPGPLRAGVNKLIFLTLYFRFLDYYIRRIQSLTLVFTKILTEFLTTEPCFLRIKIFYILIFLFPDFSGPNSFVEKCAIICFETQLDP